MRRRTVGRSMIASPSRWETAMSKRLAKMDLDTFLAAIETMVSTEELEAFAAAERDMQATGDTPKKMTADDWSGELEAFRVFVHIAPAIVEGAADAVPDAEGNV